MNSKTDQEHPRCTSNKKYDDSTFQKLKAIQACSQVPIWLEWKASELITYHKEIRNDFQIQVRKGDICLKWTTKDYHGSWCCSPKPVWFLCCQTIQDRIHKKYYKWTNIEKSKMQSPAKPKFSMKMIKL